MTRTALLALLLAAPPAAAGVVQPSLPLTETGTLRGTTTLAVGEPLLVVLPAQGGTGYAWEVAPADPAILEPQTAHCAASQGRGSPPGATVPACFAWAGRAPGTTTLSFVYRRPSETTSTPLSYQLTVTVTR